MPRWPDFLLVGAPKCATGTIYELLGRSPDVFLAPKDLYFFGSDLATTQPRLSQAEYWSQFDAAPTGARLADSSVGYLCSERAATEIHAAVPEAKIVIALRNPLDAIPSLHQHCLYYGLEEIEDLGEALAAEDDRAAGRRLPRRCAHPWMLLYTHVYRYAEQVQRYFDAFGRSRCHVVVYDDFRAEPEATMDSPALLPGAASARARGGCRRPRGLGAPRQPGAAGSQPATQRPAHRPAAAGAAARPPPHPAAAAAPGRRGGARCQHRRRRPAAASTRPCAPSSRPASSPRWRASRACSTAT